MKSFCKVMILGSVCRDAITKPQPDGRILCHFTVATNRHWKDSEGNPKSLAEFHNIATWGALAELCSGHVKKSMQIHVEGYLKTRTWELPEQPGVKIHRTEIVAENVIFIGTPPA